MPTVHPMASVGTRGQHQTRMPHNVRSAMAAIPRQEKLPGDPWGTPPSTKMVGRPPIVTATRSQLRQAIPRWRVAPEQTSTKQSHAASRAGQKPPSLSSHSGSRPTGPSQRTRPGPWRRSSRLGRYPESFSRVVVHRCGGAVRAAPVPGPTACGAPYRTGQERARYLPQRPTVAAELPIGCRPSASSRHRLFCCPKPTQSLSNIPFPGWSAGSPMPRMGQWPP